ncbi:MAG: DEAD/DEAH box helicase [Caldilineaceae bacterium SB0665_bin_25]|nr:DEAD/DEAH box helicase [Caldilineaceae bacterium SB0665_bin_25]
MPFTFHAAWLTSGKHFEDGQEQYAFGPVHSSRVQGQEDVQMPPDRSAPDSTETTGVQKVTAKQGLIGGPEPSRGLVPENGPRLFLWGENHEAPSVWEERELGENEDPGEAGRAVSAAAKMPPGPTEDTDGSRSLSTRSNGKIPSHPAQMPVGTLRQILRQFATASELTSLMGSPATASVWLPSQSGRPQTHLGSFQKGVNALSGDSEPYRLQPWQVTGLTLDPYHTLAFLSRFTNERLIELPSSTALFRHARLGNDLLFWSHAAKFVLELLAGQHFLPGLIPDSSGRFWAAWQPFLLEGSLRERLEYLVELMPPVCRAYELESLEEAPAPGTIVEHFIGIVINRAIREWSSAVEERNGSGPVRRAGGRLSSGQRTALPSSGSMWMDGLSGEDPLLQLPPQPAHQLYKRWIEWMEQLHSSVADSNFQVAFALELRADEDAKSHPDSVPAGSPPAPIPLNNWRLQYYLQDKDDPDLLIPAQRVWNQNGQSIRVDGRRFDQPQERLLTGLGIASRLFAPIRESLRAPRPERATLSLEETYLFLKEIGPLLQSSGFGVIMPEWWAARSRSRLGLRLRLGGQADSAPAGAGKGQGRPRGQDEGLGGNASLDLRGLIHFRWELTLGDQTLSREEFERLADLGSPLVRLGEEWLELDPAQVHAARQFLDRNESVGSMPLLQAVGLAQAFSRTDQESERETWATYQFNALRPEGPPEGPHLQNPTTPIDAPSDHETTEGLSEPELPLEAVVADGWLGAALERLRGIEPVEDIQEPEGFVGKLRPYQRRGVGWLSFLRQLGLGACLADDMGLGKTIQAIALLLHSRRLAEMQRQSSNGHADYQERPALLICPTSVVANWRHEIERFAPGLRLLLHHGSGRLSGEAFRSALSQHDMVITSFGIARRDIDMLETQAWSDLILDEAQNIKNPSAKQTQAIRRLTGSSSAQSEKGSSPLFRVALTGTPVENRLLELWSIMEFLNPGYLGNREHFRQQFVLPVERYNDEFAAADLRRMVQPFLLRRLKTDPTIISDLPEKNEMVVYCSLTKEQETLYTRVIEETMARVERSEGVQRRGLVLGLLLKLKQVTNHPAHYLGEKGPLDVRSGKLSRLTEMLEEALAVGDRALVFTQFVEMGHLLRRHLMENLGREALFLHGGTPAARREQMVRSFQEDSNGAPIFVLSLRAGGVGVNLTRANHVFHFDRWWNPAVENQATDRAFRIGQKRSVQVYKFVVSGTLEEQIHKMIESKQDLAESIVNSGEDWLADMDTEGLRQLIALRSRG